MDTLFESLSQTNIHRYFHWGKGFFYLCPPLNELQLMKLSFPALDYHEAIDEVAKLTNTVDFSSENIEQYVNDVFKKLLSNSLKIGESMTSGR